ncbi:MAG: flagellar motor protein MotB [Elusimicrobiota bacterium]
MKKKWKEGRDSAGEKRDFFSNSLWLTIYSDIITNLMIFFLVLYGLAAGKSSKYQEVSQAIAKQFGAKAASAQITTVREETTAREMENYFDQEGLSQFATVQINEERVRIMLSNPVLFGSGEYELAPKAGLLLKQIAALIRDLPNKIVVEGHTDNIPIHGGKFRSNWELSAARAFSVIEYLVKEEKLDPKYFSVIGYGEYQPLYPNDTSEHRAANRRIEINIQRKNTTEQ